MSMDPQAIQSLLVSQLGSNGGQPGALGSGATQGQGQTSGAALVAQLAQKAMLMKALQSAQQGQQQTQAMNMLPGTQNMMANDPTMQALQNPTLNPALTQGVGANVDPNAMAALDGG